MKNEAQKTVKETKSESNGSYITALIVGLFVTCLMFVSFQKNISVALDRQQCEIIKYNTYISEKNSLEEVRANIKDSVASFEAGISTANASF